MIRFLPCLKMDCENLMDDDECLYCLEKKEPGECELSEGEKG